MDRREFFNVIGKTAVVGTTATVGLAGAYSAMIGVDDIHARKDYIVNDIHELATKLVQRDFINGRTGADMPSDSDIMAIKNITTSHVNAQENKISTEDLAKDYPQHNVRQIIDQFETYKKQILHPGLSPTDALSIAGDFPIPQSRQVGYMTSRLEQERNQARAGKDSQSL